MRAAGSNSGLAKRPCKNHLAFGCERIAKNESRDSLFTDGARRKFVVMQLPCKSLDLFPCCERLRGVLIRLKDSAHGKDAESRLGVRCSRLGKIGSEGPDRGRNIDGLVWRDLAHGCVQGFGLIPLSSK